MINCEMLHYLLLSRLRQKPILHSTPVIAPSSRLLVYYKATSPGHEKKLLHLSEVVMVAQVDK